MAIIKGLEEGAVLYKFTTLEKRAARHPDNYWKYIFDEDGRIKYEDYTVYNVIQLYSRRNRTNGCRIPEELAPFFQKLKVKLLPTRIRRRHVDILEYTAVGCEHNRVAPEVYETLQIDEVAARYFQKIKNEELLPLMDTQEHNPHLIISSLKSVFEEDQETEADLLGEEEPVPEEPIFRIYFKEHAW